MYDDDFEDMPGPPRSRVDMVGWCAVAVAFGAGFLSAFIIWS